MGKLRLSSVRVAVQSDPESDEGAAASPSHSRKRTANDASKNYEWNKSESVSLLEKLRYIVISS